MAEPAPTTPADTTGDTPTAVAATTRITGDVETGLQKTQNHRQLDQRQLLEQHQYKLLNKKVTLYDEVVDALHGAFLMFCLPDLKALATEGVLQGDPAVLQRIVELPVTMLDVLRVYDENKAILTDERLKCDDRADMYHEALSLKRFQEIESLEVRDAILQTVKLVVLDDVNEQEEIVYAIGISSMANHITVAFRGSVTSKDFKQDAKALLSYVPNPVKKTTSNDADNLPDDVGLHLGFKEYLYGTSTERKTDPNKKPKYKVILDKLAELLEEHPDCKIRLVGHSLGGALTTVLALEAAGDERFPSPITAITSGAPKVGNLAFLRTFEHCEKQGRIRCIQVANNKDPVTQSPPIGNFDPCGPVFCRYRIFRHVGLRLWLNPAGFMIWYPMKAKTYPGILVYDWMYVTTNCTIFCCGCIFMFLCFGIFTTLVLPICCFATYKIAKKARRHHTQLKYMHRIQFCKDAIDQLDLDDLNNERFGRSVYRSRVLAKHKTPTRFDPAIFEKIGISMHSKKSDDSKNNSNGTKGDKGGANADKGGAQPEEKEEAKIKG